MLEDVFSVMIGALVSIYLCIMYMGYEVWNSFKAKRATYQGYLATDELEFSTLVRYSVLDMLSGVRAVDRMFLNIANDRISSFIKKFICSSATDEEINLKAKKLFTIVDKSRYIDIMITVRGGTLYIMPIYIKVNRFSIDVSVTDVLVATDTRLKSAIDFDLTDNALLLYIDNMDIADDAIKVELNEDNNLVVSCGKIELEPYIIGEKK